MNWPSVLSLGNLLLGSLGISLALSGEPRTACWMALAGLLADGADGWLARRLGCVSKRGARLDSTADFVTFGCLPAVVYMAPSSAPVLERALVAFFFMAAAAFRLHRFVRESGSRRANHFTGLPAPAAASVFCTGVLCGADQIAGPGTVSAFMILLGVLMVSRLPYSDPRASRKPLSWAGPVLAGAAAFLLSAGTAGTLFAMSMTYLAASPAVFVARVLAPADIPPPRV